jgi:putative membrane protein
MHWSHAQWGHMHWGDMSGWGWGWAGWVAPSLTMLIFFGGLAALIILLARRPADRPPDTAERILAERFARGDIDQDEYLQRRQTLHR